MKLVSAFLVAVLGLFVAFNVAYRAGASGLRIDGARTSFGRMHDKQLYAAGTEAAVLVDANALAGAEELAVVEPGAVAFPFSMLCGERQPDGFLRVPAKAEAAFPGRVRVEPHPTPGERPRVLVRMTAREAAATLPPLSTCNESCTTFNAAFLLVFGGLGLAALVLRVRGKLAAGGPPR